VGRVEAFLWEVQEDKNGCYRKGPGESSVSVVGRVLKKAGFEGHGAPFKLRKGNSDGDTDLRFKNQVWGTIRLTTRIRKLHNKQTVSGKRERGGEEWGLVAKNRL